MKNLSNEGFSPDSEEIAESAQEYALYNKDVPLEALPTDPDPDSEALKEADFIGLDEDGEPLPDDTKKHRKKAKRKRKKKKILIILLISFFSVLLLLLAVFLILEAIGRSQMLQLNEAKVKISETAKELGAVPEEDGKTIKYKGKAYRLNEDITTILCMGVDKGELGGDGYGANGQADANILLVIDTKTGKTTAIAINRDTMIDAHVYSDSGKFLGAEKQQLCLAFANGDGEEKSAENMKKSVSSLFYGIPINSYIAIDLEAIGPLNELVGNVKVKSPETISSYSGYFFQKGETYTLDSAAEAEAFVRARDVSVLDSNVSRMERQKVYLKAFSAAAVKKTKDELTFPLSLYNAITDYNISDLNAAKIVFLTSTIVQGRENVNLKFLNVDGEVKKGNEKAEFHHDEEKLFELILDVFYEKEID